MFKCSTFYNEFCNFQQFSGQFTLFIILITGCCFHDLSGPWQMKTLVPGNILLVTCPAISRLFKGNNLKICWSSSDGRLLDKHPLPSLVSLQFCETIGESFCSIGLFPGESKEATTLSLLMFIFLAQRRHLLLTFWHVQQLMLSYPLQATN